MPNVLFVNRSYWPDVEATGQLLTELCEDLAARDFDVSVLCGQPNKNPDDANFVQNGTEVRNGVTIRRVRHTTFQKTQGRLRRAINMASFFVSASASALFGKRPDVIVLETDPPLLCMLGYAMKKIRGVEMVLYLQDIYPDVAKSLGQLPDWFPYRFLRWVFYSIYRKSNQVVVLSTDMQRHLEASGISRDRIRIVPNWTDPEAIYPIKENNLFRQRHDLEDKFIVMYSGNLGLSQKLDVALNAAERLQDQTRILFAFVGDGARRASLESQVRRRKLSNVRFFDYQPKAELAHSLSAADLQLVLLDPKITPLLMPSKIYSVLASGTPSVILADANSELATVVSQNDAGTVCDPDDDETLAKQIQEYASDSERVKESGHRARELAVQRYTREQSVLKFAGLLNVHRVRVAASVSP